MKIKCEECESEFSQKKSLYAHLRKIHKRELVVLKNNPVVKCEHCDTKFSQKKHLYEHIRKIHKKDIFPIKNTSNFECSICKKMFTLRTNLRRHTIKNHTGKKDHNYSKPGLNTPRLICPHDSCVNNTFMNYDSLTEHLQTHNVDIQKEIHEFTCIEDFEKWKQTVEQQDMSLYVRDTAPKKLSTSETWNSFYNCHRSYCYVPGGKNIRSLKSTGSRKIGKTCPSRMKVTFLGDLNQPSIIKVLFWKTHFGHEFRLAHVSLNSQTRAEIAEKLKEGVSFNHILDTIRDNVANTQDYNQRLAILERKDLHNIVRDFNIDYGTKRHQNDAVSVKIWVSEMQETDYNPVLYSKGQDEEDNTLLCDSDFALVIMTDFQAEQLIKFGNNKICIDGTHGTNAYDIQLYTIMLVDDFGIGCPVAHCFSNRSDEYIFTLFFGKVKGKVGIVNCTVFMSDDAPAFYNAWASVMGEAEFKLLCSWHVDRNWRFNLNKIKNVDKKALVYKTVKVLQQITDINEFKTCLAQVLNQLETDEDTKSFGDYFRCHYANRPNSWAYCFRKGLGINTNMYLESYHKILKHIYLEGKKTKRLDKTINAVLKVARDSLFKRLINITKNKRTQKIQLINSSHKSSQAIMNESIKIVENEKQWMVTSSSNASVEYHVTFVQDTCSDLCLNCTACNICIHTFQCSCIDNIVKLNICKHIHACAREYFQVNTTNLPNFDETAEVSTLLNMSQSAVIRSSSNETLVKKFELIISLLHNKTDVSSEKFSALERHADNCISLLNQQNAVLLKTTEHVNVQQKVEQQHRLYSTKAKRKKKSTECSKPSTSEQTAIKDGLINATEILNIHTGFDHTYD